MESEADNDSKDSSHDANRAPLSSSSGSSRLKVPTFYSLKKSFGNIPQNIRSGKNRLESEHPLRLSSPVLPPLTSTHAALQIPEILLQIFSHSEIYHLPYLARVSAYFNGPAMTILYSHLDLNWHYSKISRVLRSFSSNSHLSSLVVSVKISSLAQENLANPEPMWSGTNIADRDIALLHFLASLHNLRHLSLLGFTSTVIPTSIKNRYWDALDKIAAGLSDINLVDMQGSLWERLLVHATSCQNLNIENSSLPSLKSPPKNLRHLRFEIRGLAVKDEFGVFLFTVKETLNTLSLISLQLNPQLVLSTRGAFSRLSHLELGPFSRPQDETIHALLKMVPVLQYFRWSDPMSTTNTLALLIPFLPTSVTRIHAEMDYDSGNSPFNGGIVPQESMDQVLTSTNHLPKLEVLSIYPGCSIPFVESIREASLQGIRLEILSLDDLEDLPTLLECWRVDRRQRI